MLHKNRQIAGFDQRVGVERHQHGWTPVIESGQGQVHPDFAGQPDTALFERQLPSGRSGINPTQVQGGETVIAILKEIECFPIDLFIPGFRVGAVIDHEQNQNPGEPE